MYVKKLKKSIKICQLKKKSKKFGKLSEAEDAVALHVFAHRFFFSVVLLGLNALPYFLVACYATLHLALSVRPLVHPSVRPSVGPSITLSGFLRLLASLLLPKWWSASNYGPGPPACDWGSRVSGLAFPKILWLVNHLCHIICNWNSYHLDEQLEKRLLPLIALLLY